MSTVIKSVLFAATMSLYTGSLLAQETANNLDLGTPSILPQPDAAKVTPLNNDVIVLPRPSSTLPETVSPAETPVVVATPAPKAAAIKVAVIPPKPAPEKGVYFYIDRRKQVHYALTPVTDQYTLLGPNNWQSLPPLKNRGIDKDLLKVLAQAKKQKIDIVLPPSLMAGYRIDKASPRTQTRLLNHRALNAYERTIVQNARRHGVDVNLVKAIMAAESGFNPGAVSVANAQGLMQVIPETGERYGVVDSERLITPHVNINVGVRYLRDLSRMFKNRPDLIIAAYNAGEGAVYKYNYQVPPYAETQAYVRKVLQYYDIYSQRTLITKVKTQQRKQKNTPVRM